MSKRKIALIYPLDDSLPLQSTSYRVYMPRYGILAVAARLINEGYEVQTYCEQSGSEVDWNFVQKADYVCYSILSFSAFKAYEYTQKVSQINPKAIQIYGGSHASLAADDCLDHVDYVIRNEGEETLVDLLSKLEQGNSVKDVLGLSLNFEGEKKHNVARPFISDVNQVLTADLIKNYKKRSIGTYIKDIFTIGMPRFNVVVSQSSRGCPFDCKFCFVKIELGKQYRRKTPEMVLMEIENGINQLGSKYVMFVDNDFCISKNHTLEVLKLIEEKYYGDIDLFIFTRITVAFDQDIVEAFKRAGRVCLALGIESIESDTQTEYKKEFSNNSIENALKILNDNGIKYHALFVVGSDYDTQESIDKILKFSIKNNAFYMGLQILYDFPRKEIVTKSEQCIPDHRYIHHDWRFFSGTFVIHFPKKIRPSVLQESVVKAHMDFYKKSKFFIQFYATKGIMRSYIKYLRMIEHGLYDENDILDEAKLENWIQEKKIEIKFNLYDYLLELGRFYAMNIFRKDSWMYLLSIVKPMQKPKLEEHSEEAA
ncbi:radical SAM protein [Bacteriovorax sp. Seq25_V]|uniref:B12-binding domain-containing radical SAM protein n=1 Tax=Bacteriovorax sp. Seq25_V TaxID=1201288 RepID=UPI00038A226D|nr:radical SAM protein [Bacteriovorax sp. Seq25_V]EQC46866.1 radical SAM domain protein [Bacteriovorax sp. Seq25_V]